MKIYVLCGLPGSGKSTIAKKINGYVICPDAIRKELTGDEDDQSRNKEVFETAYRRLYAASRGKRDVIFDATNTTTRARHEILKRCPDNAEKIAVVLDVPFKTAKERNAGRDRVVPDHVMQRMKKQFSMPSVYEGFDKIIII